MDIGKDAGALAREKRDYLRSVTTRLNRSTVVYAIIIHNCFNLACVAPLSGLGALFPFFSRPYSKARTIAAPAEYPRRKLLGATLEWKRAMSRAGYAGSSK